jgi:hypothetical protein
MPGFLKSLFPANGPQFSAGFEQIEAEARSYYQLVFAQIFPYFRKVEGLLCE